MIRIYLLVLVGLARTAFSEQASPALDEPRQRVRLAESFVNQRLEVWKKRLDLGTWQVSIAMCHRSEMKQRTLGAIRWDKSRKSAEIQVLDASEYRVPLPDMLDDMEFTVVHELIHLELASLPRSQASRSDEERAVNQMARALLNLDRKTSEIGAGFSPANVPCESAASRCPEVASTSTARLELAHTVGPR